MGFLAPDADGGSYELKSWILLDLDFERDYKK